MFPNILRKGRTWAGIFGCGVIVETGEFLCKLLLSQNDGWSLTVDCFGWFDLNEKAVFADFLKGEESRVLGNRFGGVL